MSNGEVTALAPVASGPRAVMFRSLDDVERFAELVYKSNLVPKEYRHNKADVVGVISFGLELGLNPMAALQNISWINGKPAVYGDMMLAMVEASGLLESFDEVEAGEAQTSGIGRCTLKRRGKPPITRTYTQAMAQTAGLWGQNTWKTHPGRMLQMRARGWALRDAFSDVLKGLYTVEEARDIVLMPDASGTWSVPNTPPVEAPSTPLSAPAGDGAGAVVSEPSEAAGAGPMDAPSHPAATAPAATGCAGLTPEAIAAMPRSAVRNKIVARCKELAPGTSEEARHLRRTYLQEACGVDSPEGLDDVGITRLRQGLVRLLELRPEIAPPVGEAGDVRLGEAAPEVAASVPPSSAGPASPSSAAAGAAAASASTEIEPQARSMVDDLGRWGPLHSRALRAGISPEAWALLRQGPYPDAVATVEGAEAGVS